MRNPNHPKRGTSIKVQPIRSLDAIDQIKALLRDQPRNLCLFIMGINTAYRANELLSLTVGHVTGVQVGDELEIKQSKNKRYRLIVLNGVTVAAVQEWLAHHPRNTDLDAPLFMSNHYRHQALTVSAVNQLVKGWCRAIGIFGNYGSHSLRKTWGYHERTLNNASVAVLMRAFGHASEAQTLDYLGILSSEIRELYLGMEL